MIGHGGLLSVFLRSPDKGIRSRGYTPRHAQTAGDLGFAMQFNAETVAFRAAPLSSGRMSSYDNFRHCSLRQVCRVLLHLHAEDLHFVRQPHGTKSRHIFETAVNLDHATSNPMPIDSHPPDDSGEPAND